MLDAQLTAQLPFPMADRDSFTNANDDKVCVKYHSLQSDGYHSGNRGPGGAWHTPESRLRAGHRYRVVKADRPMPKRPGEAAPATPPNTNQASARKANYGHQCSHAHDGLWSGPCNEPDLQNLLDTNNLPEDGPDTTPRSIVATELDLQIPGGCVLGDGTPCNTGDNLIPNDVTRIRSTICLVGVTEWMLLRAQLQQIFQAHGTVSGTGETELGLRAMMDNLRDVGTNVSPHFADCVGSFNAMVTDQAWGNV
ncbi:unnamed protein product [Amoebophrya sp. A120]|nr:unnamed protein product [Amoebophrya sp. A120]|eukprot:GSA120T00016368001.1